MNRRDFLKRIIKSFFLVIGSVLVFLIVTIYPSRTKKKVERFIPILDEDELPRAGVKRVDFSYERDGRKIRAKVFLAVSKEGLLALSPVCSHLGCLVNWDNFKQAFLCPCHGGRYSMSGDVIAGPPPAPLKRLPLEMRKGKVYVGMKI
ncbi:MAG: ubiquinol-cytochrome c reductase iron-sulfur subunit [Thermodesulfovibrionales bacterium]|jgi:cytochrome b6-f complex iron-sulfur subunit